MDAAIVYVLLFSSIFLSIAAFEANCPTLKCSNGAPDIQFPFWVSGHQPQNCTSPGFQLACKNNTTIIHFPTYGELVVKSISYNERKLQLIDPKNCVHQVFLNLNLSFTPFQYYYTVKNYTYLKCSTRLSPPFVEVPCLSGCGHHVYTVEASLGVPVSCRPVKTVAIPFSFSPYLSDNSFGLGFTWTLPGSEDSKTGLLKVYASLLEQDKGFWIKQLSIGDICAKFMKVGLCILAVAMLLSIKIYHSKKLPNHNLFEGLNSNKTGNEQQAKA